MYMFQAGHCNKNTCLASRIYTVHTGIFSHDLYPSTIPKTWQYEGWRMVNPRLAETPRPWFKNPSPRLSAPKIRVWDAVIRNSEKIEYTRSCICEIQNSRLQDCPIWVVDLCMSYTVYCMGLHDSAGYVTKQMLSFTYSGQEDEQNNVEETEEVWCL